MLSPNSNETLYACINNAPHYATNIHHISSFEMDWFLSVPILIPSSNQQVCLCLWLERHRRLEAESLLHEEGFTDLDFGEATRAARDGVMSLVAHMAGTHAPLSINLGVLLG